MLPFHKHKRSHFREEFKTLNDIFDLTSEQTVWKLIKQGVIEGLEGPLSIGKEANVFLAITKDGERRVVKMYRVTTCDFNKMYAYIAADPRFPSLHKNRRQVVSAWCQREFRNLLKAREAGCRVPTPFAALNNVLVMEFIGDESASQKVHTEAPAHPKAFFDQVTTNMHLLHKAGLVHGDLSQFNILNCNEEPVLIDFSQTTTRENPNFEEYLARDIKNVAAYFMKLGVKTSEESLRKKIMTE